MKLAAIPSALEKAGTENRKVYPRHGVTSPLHGVSFAEYKKIKMWARMEAATAKAAGCS